MTQEEDGEDKDDGLCGGMLTSSPADAEFGELAAVQTFRACALLRIPSEVSTTDGPRSLSFDS